MAGARIGNVELLVVGREAKAVASDSELFSNKEKDVELASALNGQSFHLALVSVPDGNKGAICTVEELLDAFSLIETVGPLKEDSRRKMPYPAYFAYEHGFLEAEEISAISDFLIVRRARRPDKVIGYTMRSGSELKMGGKLFQLRE